MADVPRPQSQIILDQLVTWLQEISQSSGYFTDAGDDVRTEQTRDEAPDAPCLYLFDEQSDWSPVSGSSKGLWTQRFTLEGLVLDDGNGRLRSRQLLADIHRALRRPLTAWPPAAGVSALREVSREIPARPQSSDWLTPTVTIEIDIVDKEVTPP